ncbi:MAG: YncE family protein [Vicinamibacteria bacterium]
MLATLCSVLILAGAPAEGRPKPKVSPAGYRLHRTIPLPGNEGWDYLTVDPEARRLYVTRGERVVVLDLATDRVAGEIPGTAGVHGVALAKDLKRGFASNGRSDSVTLFDLERLTVVGEVAVGKKPDAILYDPFSHRVFVFCRDSASATALEAAQGTVAGAVELGGAPEFAVSDGKGTIYVNLEDTNEVVGFGSQDLKVRSRWPLAPCQTPTGLAIDRAKGRLFSGCRNQVMAVLDTSSGQVVAALPIGKGVDGVAVDPGRGLAFASNADGTLTVVREAAPAHFVVVENVTTLPGARTMALDPKAHRLYLATAQFGAPPPATAGNPRPRGPMLPGTFVILVFGK